MTEPIIPVADELTEASKYAEVVDPRNSVESDVFLTGEELIRVLHPSTGATNEGHEYSRILRAMTSKNASFSHLFK